jgi:hypothetical protein
VHRAALLGLEVESDFPLVGVSGGESTGRLVSLTTVPREALERDWPKQDVRRTNEQRLPDGRLAIGIDHHPEAGYRFEIPRYGRYVVSLDGRHVRCAPPRMAAWRWQRLLLSQVLPVAATAQGLELLHASGVTFGERAVGIVGRAGSGKTSLGAQLVLGGAGFLTDDVLALEARGGGLVAYPGAATLSLRSTELSGVPAASRRRLGNLIGRSGKAIYEVPRDTRALPLTALYFPRHEPGGEARIEPHKPTFPELVANNFNWNVTTGERLERLLEVASLIAAGVETHSVLVPDGVDWAGVAELVARHESEGAA